MLIQEHVVLGKIKFCVGSDPAGIFDISEYQVSISGSGPEDVCFFCLITEQVKSSQVTIICIALLAMQIVSKQLYISLISSWVALHQLYSI